MVSSGLAGVGVVALAGISNGSFPAPSKGISLWKWEHVWLIYSLVAMALLPLGAAMLLDAGMLRSLLARDPALAAQVAGFGFLWGLGSVLFGLSLVRLGMAITNALISGVVVFSGSLGPLLLGAADMSGARLGWLIAGLLLLAASLGMCATASLRRDEVRGLSRASGGGSPVAGVALAVLAGVLSSMLNYGFVTGAPLAVQAAAAGCPAVFATVAIWIPALMGGLLPNALYPAWLLATRRSWSLFAQGGSARWGRAAAMGVLWFCGVLLYGWGASLMGSAGSVYGWALLVAMSILTSNAWGLATGEWHGAGRGPMRLMWISTALLIASAAVISVSRAAA